MTRTIFVMTMFATPAFADSGEYGHMMGDGYGYGPSMMFGPVVWIVAVAVAVAVALALGLVVAGIIWLVRRLDHATPQGGASSAMAELDLRLAKGEIDADEYSSRKKLLSA